MHSAKSNQTKVESNFETHATPITDSRSQEVFYYYYSVSQSVNSVQTFALRSSGDNSVEESDSVSKGSACGALEIMTVPKSLS